MIISRFASEICLQEARSALIHALPASGPLLLLLSGGSCLNLLTEEFFKRLPENTTILPLDERFSQRLEDQNSWQLAKRIPFSWQGLEFREGESLENFTERYTTNLDTWLSKYPEGCVLASLGIGEDGHTAGILPNTQAALTEDKLVVGYEAHDQYEGRISVTFAFLRQHVTKAIAYAVGSQKRQALALLETELSLYQAPCRILLQMKDVELITDQV